VVVAFPTEELSREGEGRIDQDVEVGLVLETDADAVKLRVSDEFDPLDGSAFGLGKLHDLFVRGLEGFGGLVGRFFAG